MDELSGDHAHQRKANEERDGPRSSVFLSALIDSECGLQQVRLRNVSAGGTLVEGKDLPEAGSPVTIHRDQRAMHARLVWVDGNHGGVVFDRPLAEDDPMLGPVSLHRPDAFEVPARARAIDARYRRPAVCDHQLSETERKWLAHVDPAAGRYKRGLRS